MRSPSDKPNKVMTSLRLTPQARSLISQLAGQMRLTQADVVETAVKDLARRQARKAAKSDAGKDGAA